MSRPSLFAVFVALALAASPVVASTRYESRLRFRTISTARFDIHYHQGEDALAQRLARIAEDVAARLSGTLGLPSGRVQVILVDQDDLSNGWATPVPYNTIEISAATPAADSIIGNADDWLRLVFTHEYVHIVHLSRTGGWIGGLRKVFGRLPVLFPNGFQPVWQIEGIATWQESAETGYGRLHAGDFRLFLERAAADRRLEPIDRASGRLVDWPSGNTPYLYGGHFHQYLADRYGAESLRKLTDETARRLPYFGSRAYRKVYGKSLGALWAEFEASIEPAREDIAAERLTRHGFYVTGPRFARDGRVLYSLVDPHGFPSLRELDLETRRWRTVTTRYLGDHVGLAGDTAVFDQIDIAHEVGRQWDLYTVGLRDGDVRRLSYGARAADPDVSPDGLRLAFTVQRADRRELATAPLAPAFRFEPAPLVSAPGVAFASPRWSPDGTRLAAERRIVGGPSQIVSIDVATGAVDAIVPDGRNANPIWSPDGSTIYFASARGDDPFRIFAVAATGGPIRRLEGTGLSAQFPAIAPDGRTLVFVGYTADGYDLFALPLGTATWTSISGLGARGSGLGGRGSGLGAGDSGLGGRDSGLGARDSGLGARDSGLGGQTIGAGPEVLPSRGYSPLRTILPTFWVPTIEVDQDEAVFGAAVGSVDALGRHAYAIEAGWTASRARPDWQAAYAYDRWRPTIFGAVSDDTDPWRGGERRLVEASAGMLWTTRRIRRTRTVLAELHTSDERFECPADGVCDRPAIASLRRDALRAGVGLDASRMFGYSISPEEGGRVSATVETARSTTFEGAGSGSATVDGRGYARAWPRHAAIAVRAAAAASWGDEAVRRVFSASGNEPQPGGFRFGSDAIGLLRGVAEDRVLGHRAAVVNVDYRLRLAHVERGIGTLPVSLKAVHGAVFADTGHAWSGRFHASDLRYSIGAELSIDTVLAFVAPVTFAGGVAWRKSPDPDERGVAAFVRIGRAF